MRGAAVIGTLAVLLIAGGAAAQTPKLSHDEAVALFAAGGFTVVPGGTQVRNACGTSAEPRVSFVDLNGDALPDALFVDHGACYGSDGSWFSLAVKGRDGRWHRVAGATGSAKAAGTVTHGWQDILWTHAGRTEKLVFSGSAYAVAAAPAPAPKPAPPPGAAPYSTENAPEQDDTAAIAALPAAAQDAILAAAGAHRVGGAWRLCSDDPQYPDEVSLTMYHDLNGDGRIEAMVSDISTACFGVTGTGTVLLSQTPAGGWQKIADTQGGLVPLTSHGPDGMPDMMVAMAGMCLPVLRWDGRAYQIIGHTDGERPCTPP